MLINAWLTIFAVVFVILHVGTFIMVWFEDWPWSRRLLWAVLIACIPILGPLHYLQRTGFPVR